MKRTVVSSNIILSRSRQATAGRESEPDRETELLRQLETELGLVEIGSDERMRPLQEKIR
jgi:hypothetical protein